MDEKRARPDDLTDILWASAASLPGDPERRVRGWLDTAGRLMLDGRADPDALVTLVASAGGEMLEVLDRYPPATAAVTGAVLAGWRDAGMPGTGRAAAEPHRGWRLQEWNGQQLNHFLPCLAVWHAAAAQRLGLDAGTARVWAACGLIDVGNAPEPPGVADPTDPDSEGFADDSDAGGADADEDYEELARWANGIGPGDAPLWFKAGYDSEDAVFLAGLLNEDPRKPSMRELQLRRRPPGPRIGPPG
jgi:hypothetical protein